MLVAAGGFVCFLAVAVSSVRAARKKLQYETWHFLHFYAYLGIALAVPHQIFTGGTFAANGLAIAYWSAMYLTAIGAVAVFRFGMPLRNFSKHDLRVSEVRRENGDTISIYITGKHLSHMNAQAGQYFNWRFLDRDNWTAAHPFSLSAAPPQGRDHPRDRLRITIKQVGMGSRKLEHIEPGTRVMAEGPYGAFTPEVRSRRRVLLVAGGVGVTPIRALLEALPARAGDISMVYRAHAQRDLLFIDEIRELAARRRVFLHVILGSREEFPSHFPPLGPDHLRHVAPDITDRDVYVCGSDALMQHVLTSLVALDVPSRQVHYESFNF
jgi:predicted ferric reductase